MNNLSNLIIYQDQDLMLINKPAGMVVNKAKTVKDQTIQDWFYHYLIQSAQTKRSQIRLTQNKSSQARKNKVRQNQNQLNSIKSSQDKQQSSEQQLEIESEISKRDHKVQQDKKSSDQQAWSKLVPADFSDQYGSPQEIFERRQGIVHRLDKDTSGILLLAKNPGSLVNLLAQFKQRHIDKSYLCLVHGKFKAGKGRINLPLGRSKHAFNKRSVRISGKTAVTQYQVLATYEANELIQYLMNLQKHTKQKHTAQESVNKSSQSSQISHNEDKENYVNQNYLNQKKLKKMLRSYQAGFSLLKCKILTGRTHQIRVHLAQYQRALVGDQLYSGKKRIKLDQMWCQRQFLHAYSLEFKHPRTGEVQQYQADLAADLVASLKKLNPNFQDLESLSCQF